MASFWQHVNDVIEKADIIIEVLDARMISQTRNIEVEHKVKESKKILLYCINKCDLVDPEKTKKLSHFLKPGVFISSTQKLGTTILKKKILELGHGKPVLVGVVGYPNVGKSSVINALSGRGAARTSSQSGFTRGLQKVKVDNKTNYLNERDQNQLEQGQIQAGGLDPKAGTQLSRFLGRLKVAKNTIQLKRRAKKTENKNNPEIKINANIAKNTEELNNAAIKAGANDPKIGNMFTRLINKGKVAINKKQIKRDSKKITKLNEIS